MKIDVIACGESALNYVNTGNTTVGVNDCYRIYPVDYLVCVDLPSAFNRERLTTIVKSKPKMFYSQLYNWNAYFENFELLVFSFSSGNLTYFNNKPTIAYSNNSAFVACSLAYKLGAKEIFLYGADFNTHPNFTEENNLKKTLKDFNALNEKLLQLGCKLRVTKESKLSSIIESI